MVPDIMVYYEAIYSLHSTVVPRRFPFHVSILLSFVSSVKTRWWDEGLSTPALANNEPLILLSRSEKCGVSLVWSRDYAETLKVCPLLLIVFLICLG